MNKFLAVVGFISVLSGALAQFPNGRFLEPPVAALCAQRVIHERAPDNKGYVKSFLLFRFLAYKIVNFASKIRKFSFSTSDEFRFDFHKNKTILMSIFNSHFVLFQILLLVA